MKLIELNPAWEAQGGYTVLAFDCPKCGGRGLDQRLAIPTPPHPKAWQFSSLDIFENLTVMPSIDFKHGDWNSPDPAAVKCHAHFFITNGEIKLV